MCSIRRNIAVFVTDFLRSLKMNYCPTRAERAVQTPIALRSQHPIAWVLSFGQTSELCDGFCGQTMFLLQLLSQLLLRVGAMPRKDWGRLVARMTACRHAAGTFIW